MAASRGGEFGFGRIGEGLRAEKAPAVTLRQITRQVETGPFCARDPWLDLRRVPPAEERFPTRLPLVTTFPRPLST